MTMMNAILRRIGSGIRSVIAAVRLVNPFSGGPDVIADRRAMYGDDPANDPRRMDFDADRPVHRRR